MQRITSISDYSRYAVCIGSVFLTFSLGLMMNTPLFTTNEINYIDILNNVNWETFFATIIGALISGLVGILTTNYRAWRENQAAIQEWYERTAQRIKYTSQLMKAEEDGLTFGEVEGQPGSTTEALNHLINDLETQQRNAPTAIDTETLQLLTETRSYCHDFANNVESRAIHQFDQEDKPPQKLAQKAKKEAQGISINLLTYLRS